METTDVELEISKFSEYPGPRYCIQGAASGEEYYHKILNGAFVKAYTAKKKLIISLDGTAGYASSFLDEAFGNLVFDFSSNIVQSTVEIISREEPDWKEMILSEVYANWEARRKKDDSPRVTIMHVSWSRLVANEIKEKVWLST
jgi:hypothetical protein